MHERLEKRIEDGLEKIVASCQKRKQLPAAVGQRVGRLRGKNSRAAGSFEVKIDLDADGFAKCSWKKMDRWREWALLSEGCYVSRSNVADWSPEELWRAYMHRTEAKAKTTVLAKGASESAVTRTEWIFEERISPGALSNLQRIHTRGASNC